MDGALSSVCQSWSRLLVVVSRDVCAILATQHHPIAMSNSPSPLDQGRTSEILYFTCLYDCIHGEKASRPYAIPA